MWQLAMKKESTEEVDRSLKEPRLYVVEGKILLVENLKIKEVMLG